MARIANFPGRLFHRTLPMLLILLASLLSHPTAAAPHPRQTVVYIEHTDGSVNDDIARRMVVEGNSDLKIDIDSRVEITFDTDALSAIVTGNTGATDAVALRKQAESLSEMIDNLEKLRQLWNQATDAYQVWESSPSEANLQAFRQWRKRVAGTTEDMLNRLYDAVGARLALEQYSEEAINLKLDALYEEINQAPRVHNVNWPILREVIQRELDLLTVAIDHLPVAELEIRAYHVTSDDAPKAVHLPRYNDAPSCQAAQFNRIVSTLPPDVAAAYQKRQELSAKLENTTSLLDAMMQLAENEYRIIEPDLRLLLGSLRANVTPLETSLKKVLQWQDATKWQAWLDSVKDQLAQDEAFRSDIERINVLVDTINQDIAALKKLGELPEDLAGMRPEATIQELVQILLAGPFGERMPVSISPKVWRDRAEFVKSVLASVDAKSAAVRSALEGPGSPIADLRAAVDEIEDIPSILTNATRQVQEFVAKVTGYGFAAPLADLEAPPGNRRVRITDNPNTEFNLKTFCGERHHDDQVVVEYTVYLNGENLHLDWVDTFRMQVMDASAKYFASTGFVQQSGTDSYEPSALITWTLKYRNWPNRKQKWYGYFPGVLANNFLFSGIGVSVLNVDFSEEKDIETGFALTQAMLCDHVMLGYGYNPFADGRRDFWFVSVRLFGNTQSRTQTAVAP